MSFDPFAMPVDEPATAVAEPNVEVVSSKVVITLKGGAGFDSPWIVIHAQDVHSALSQISGDNAATLAELIERVHTVSNHFARKPAGGGSAAPVPAGAMEPPPGAPPSPGDGWTYKTGISKSGRNVGKTWQAWMPPQGSSLQPVFF